jgi:hypothetical protein
VTHDFTIQRRVQDAFGHQLEKLADDNVQPVDPTETLRSAQEILEAPSESFRLLRVQGLARLNVGFDLV